MKEHPILFKPDMVAAILKKQKFQTRRIIKPQPTLGIVFTEDLLGKCKYKKNDLLWVRERFALRLGFWDNDVKVHNIDGINVIYYQESCEFEWQDGDGFAALRKDGQPRSYWKPSIFMPKKFCRLWLKVKSVKVEQLQDISEDDALAEGIRFLEHSIITGQDFYGVNQGNYDLYAPNAYTSYMRLWDSINGQPRKDGVDISFAGNPWVWVVEFEMTENPKI